MAIDHMSVDKKALCLRVAIYKKSCCSILKNGINVPLGHAQPVIMTPILFHFMKLYIYKYLVQFLTIYNILTVDKMIEDETTADEMNIE